MFEEQVGWAARGGCRLRDRRDLPVLRGGAARGRGGHRRRPRLRRDARDLPRAGDVRRRRRGRGLPPARRRRRRRRRAQLHARPADDAAAARADRRRRSTSRSRRCPCPTARRRTTPAFVSLCDAGLPAPPGGRAFPTALDPLLCTRYEIADFTARAAALGVRYLGLCCGAGPHHIRAMAEALGRTPPASRYSADMSRHAVFGERRTPRPSRAPAMSSASDADRASSAAASSASPAPTRIERRGIGVTVLEGASVGARRLARQHRLGRAEPVDAARRARHARDRPARRRSTRAARSSSARRSTPRGCAGCGSSAATAVPSASAAACSRWSS